MRHGHTQEQLAAVGLVAIESASFELYLERLIWKLCRLPESKGRLFTDGMRLKGKLDMFKDLAMQTRKSKEVREHLMYWHGLAADAVAKRNTLIHGAWEIEIDPKLGVLESFVRLGYVKAIRTTKHKTYPPIHASEALKVARMFALCDAFLQCVWRDYFVQKKHRSGWLGHQESLEQVRESIRTLNRSSE